EVGERVVEALGERVPAARGRALAQVAPGRAGVGAVADRKSRRRDERLEYRRGAPFDLFERAQLGHALGIGLGGGHRREERLTEPFALERREQQLLILLGVAHVRTPIANGLSFGGSGWRNNCAAFSWLIFAISSSLIAPKNCAKTSWVSGHVP